MTDPRLLALVEARTPLHRRLLEGEAGEQVIRRRMRESGAGDLETYCRRLAEDPVELEALVVAIAVPETWFFRYRASWEYLAEKLRDHPARNSGRSLFMLSAPCATGPEPLSLVATALHAGWPLERIEVEAVDVSAVAVATASRSAERPLPLREPLPPWAEMWFEHRDGGVVARPEILARIRFAHADLFAWSPEEGRRFDVILCRNLLIYLAPESRRRILDRCGRWLADDGVLLVGHADHDARSVEGFESVGVPQTFAYRRRRTPADSSTRPAPASPTRPERPKPRISKGGPGNAAPAAPQPLERRAAQPQVEIAPVGSSPIGPELGEARRLADLGRLDEAAVLAEAGLKHPGREAESLELLGSIRLAQGRLELASECFRSLVYLDPQHEAGLLQLALLAEHAGDRAEAARLRDRAARASRRSEADLNS